MRTQDEIVERVKVRTGKDFLGFEIGCYCEALTRDSAERLRGLALRQDADLSEWEALLTSDHDIRKRCIEYMEFAWGKANDCRGISANRSIMHYQAWLWLLGEDGFDDLTDNYEFYGKPQLERICRFLWIDPKQWRR